MTTTATTLTDSPALQRLIGLSIAVRPTTEWGKTERFGRMNALRELVALENGFGWDSPRGFEFHDQGDEDYIGATFDQILADMVAEAVEGTAH